MSSSSLNEPFCRYCNKLKYGNSNNTCNFPCKEYNFQFAREMLQIHVTKMRMDLLFTKMDEAKKNFKKCHPGYKDWRD